MRLFVALVPPAAILDEIERLTADARAASPDLRWVRREQLHLTLAFLGEVGDDRLPDLSGRLARVARRYPPLNLSFAGAGRFGDRVLWTRVRGNRDQLRLLAMSVAAAARRAKIAVEDRPYRPHLTLARCRQPVDLRALVAGLVGFDGSVWTAADLHLVRSRLGREPRYETQRTWPLAGTGTGRAVGKPAC